MTDTALDADVLVYAQERGIEEVLHFTTNRGLIGVLSRGKVYSRDHLNQDDYLDSVKLLNCATRERDKAWTGYVNMSLTTVNKSMLNTSEGWHRLDNIWWAVLSFNVEILAHPGVYFAATNNVYSQAKQTPGLAGLHAMFAPFVEWGHYGSTARRNSAMNDAQPTHVQAEVLYPEAVPLSYLRSIYVHEPEHTDEIAGLVATFPDVPSIDVFCRPEVFR
jgi:hypothetical protein